ncbi:hypothetical protein AUC70_05760 [Methyloceanibacter stevinii]|uniref:HTH araC/xylS-type domain-containing protein n=1 Tax=Methyloceanibacter stevinii TaxID=1774970 RepID=A0A1E3VNV4_9HYPH|nr:AraC family transcriptional regulator [Methyloceanibacter stevinii]ODR95204.1 hypothetical protein AUC70_05760 [Methyloceanibacter stevinii]
MIECIQSTGLEVSLSKSDHKVGEDWTNTVPTGLWCGAMAQGAVATVSDRHGRQEWFDGPKNAICKILLDEEIDAQHLPLRDGTMLAAFVRVLPEALSETVGPEWLATIEMATPSARRIEGTIGSTLAWQMLGCPLSGAARRLYLTGKAMELVSVVLDACVRLDEAGQRGEGSSGLPSKDIRRLYEARAILIENLENPPTVPALARAVGLNARKLGMGFKELFGSSVYAFVKNRRLEHAHLLLQNGDVNVAQAAYACGYQPAHFSAAFRQRFGIPPSALMLGRKRPV